MAGDLKVVIVDDDAWKREGMQARLDDCDAVRVIGTVDQDTAAQWPLERWDEVDVVLVDVFDDRAPGEVGTDLYSGVRVVQRVRDLPLRCIAVTPSCAHPLVQLRLHQAEPDFCYHRFQLATAEALADALRYPTRTQQVLEPDPFELVRLGARRLSANAVVDSFVESPLHGRLTAESGVKELKALSVSRRVLLRVRRQVVGHGYRHIDTLTDEAKETYDANDVPRWPVVRDLVLKLLGRLDGPWSEYDRPWWSARS